MNQEFDFKKYVNRFENLSGEIREGVIKDVPYKYFVFLDSSGCIKWKIIPVMKKAWKLLHYYSGKFHVQGTEWQTKRGFTELILKIEEHEKYKPS
jgi:hypothetical protein